MQWFFHTPWHSDKRNRLAASFPLSCTTVLWGRQRSEDPGTGVADCCSSESSRESKVSRAMGGSKGSKKCQRKVTEIFFCDHLFSVSETLNRTEKPESQHWVNTTKQSNTLIVWLKGQKRKEKQNKKKKPLSHCNAQQTYALSEENPWQVDLNFPVSNSNY